MKFIITMLFSVISIEINSSIIECSPKIGMGFSMSHRRDVAGMFWLETIPSLSD